MFQSFKLKNNEKCFSLKSVLQTSQAKPFIVVYVQKNSSNRIGRPSERGENHSNGFRFNFKKLRNFFNIKFSSRKNNETFYTDNIMEDLVKTCFGKVLDHLFV